MELEMAIDGNTYRVSVHKEGSTYRVNIAGNTMHVTCRELTSTSRLLVRDGQTRLVHLVCQGEEYQVCVRGCALTVKSGTRLPADPAATGRLLSQSGQVRAPMPGRLIRLLVHVGQRVSAGDRLAVLEAMKMEHDIRAPVSGTVSRLNYSQEALVDAGQPLLEIEPDEVESNA